MITIMKGRMVYIGCADGQLFPGGDIEGNPFAGCVWMEYTTNATSVTASVGAEPPDYTTVPPAQINCVPWVYDASKFDVSGKSCNMQEIMKSYGAGGAGNPYQ